MALAADPTGDYELASMGMTGSLVKGAGAAYTFNWSGGAWTLTPTSTDRIADPANQAIFFKLVIDSGVVSSMITGPNEEFTWERKNRTAAPAPPTSSELLQRDIQRVQAAYTCSPSSLGVMSGSWMLAEIVCPCFEHVNEGFLIFAGVEGGHLKMTRPDTGECRAYKGPDPLMTAASVSMAWDANSVPVPSGCYQIQQTDATWDGTYALELGPESRHSDTMELAVLAGEDNIIWWNTPMASWAPMLTYSKFRISYNGQLAHNCKHSGAGTPLIQTGAVAGQAVRCVGPGKATIDFEYTRRPRKLAPRLPAEFGREYVPFESFREQGASNHPLIPCSAAQLQEPSFVQWLQQGRIDQLETNESPMNFARRVFLHMAKTMTYSFSLAAQSARTSPGSIVSFGATDCGGSAIIFCAALQRHGIRTRSVLSVLHVFPEMYVEGIGWVPCDGFVGSDGIGLSGHTVAIGGPPVLDLSHVGGLPNTTTCCQMPLNSMGSKIAQWEGGRNAPGAVPDQ